MAEARDGEQFGDPCTRPRTIAWKIEIMCADYRVGPCSGSATDSRLQPILRCGSGHPRDELDGHRFGTRQRAQRSLPCGSSASGAAGGRGRRRGQRRTRAGCSAPSGRGGGRLAGARRRGRGSVAAWRIRDCGQAAHDVRTHAGARRRGACQFRGSCGRDRAERRASAGLSQAGGSRGRRRGTVAAADVRSLDSGVRASADPDAGSGTADAAGESGTDRRAAARAANGRGRDPARWAGSDTTTSTRTVGSRRWCSSIPGTLRTGCRWFASQRVRRRRRKIWLLRRGECSAQTTCTPR